MAVVKVNIPAPLRGLLEGKAELEIEATNVKDVINELIKLNPEFKERLLDDSGNLRRFINIYVNGEDIRFTGGLETLLKDGDDVSIIPAVAGGQCCKQY